MPNVKITVKDTILKLKEKNPSPKKMYNKSELTEIVLALMNDAEYVAKNTKIKSGAFITEDRHLADDFRKALIDVLKGVGLKQAEAEEIATAYKIPKSLAGSIIDLVHAGDFLYMSEVGKGIKFIGESDVEQTMYLRGMNERSHRIPQTGLNGAKSDYSSVKVAPHARIALKTKVNPSFRKLLK